MESSFEGVFLIGFSGVIGAGKSTILRRIKELQNEPLVKNHLPKGHTLRVVLEPVEEWEREGYLQAFYDDPETNALAFQMIAFDSYVEQIEFAMKAVAERPLILLVERTMLDQMLFWTLQIDQKRATANWLGDEAYQRIWKRWNRFIPDTCLRFYYRVSDPMVAAMRIKKRNRGAEIKSSGEELRTDSADLSAADVDGVDIPYITSLWQKHEEWFGADSGAICIDGDHPHHKSDGSLEKLIQQIFAEFIKK